MTFTHKGYGRIYVENADDVEKVYAIVKELDEFEFGYMPPGLVAVLSEYPRVVYLHKFSDMDMDALTVVCWKRGLKIFCFDSGHNEFPVDATKVVIA